MTSRAVLPAFRTIALWAFALNSAWEFAQCPIFYEMSDLPLAASVLWMAGAILGDVVIVLSLVVFARQVVSPWIECREHGKRVSEADGLERSQRGVRWDFTQIDRDRWRRREREYGLRIARPVRIVLIGC